MATFYFTLSANYRLELDFYESGTSIPGNSSSVPSSLGIRKLSGSGRFQSSPASYWSVNIDGQPFSGSIPGYDFTAYTFLTLFAGTLTIIHNPDGSKTISGSGSFSEGSSNIGSGTASGSITLSLIPRASTPTFSVGGSPVTTIDAGAAVQIDTNRATGTFTHELSYDFGTLTNQTAGLTASTGVGASTSFTPPLALLNEIPAALSGTLTLRTKTYSGATLIGEKTSTLTITVPTGTAYEPDFGTITNSDTVTAVVTNIGAYVQARSKLALAITSAVGAYGSTIASSKISVGGVDVLAATGATPASGTMANAIAASGTVAIVGTVTDTRGRTHSETVNVTVLAYTEPAITASQVRRSLSGGTVDESGTYIRTDLTAAVASLIVSAVQKNAITVKISTRDHAVGGAFTLKTTLTPAAITYNSHAEVGTYSVGSSFDVLIEVTDKLTTVATFVTAVVTTAGVFMHWGGVGQGVGLGKYWETGRGSLDAIGRLYQLNGEPVQSAIAATDTAMGPARAYQRDGRLSGLATGLAVTPAGLKFAALDRITALEAAPAVQGIIPSSVVVGSGSASVGTDGTVTFTGASSVSLNDIFDGLGADMYQFYFSCRSSVDLVNVLYRLRAAGVDLVGTGYGAQYSGVVSGGGSNGGASSGLTAGYFAYGRTQDGQTAYGVISAPRKAASVKTLHTNTFGYNYVVYNMGSFVVGATAYPSLTIFPSSGTITGTLKVVKL